MFVTDSIHPAVFLVLPGPECCTSHGVGHAGLIEGGGHLELNFIVNMALNLTMNLMQYAAACQ
jgi:hypothetical protein